MRRAKKIIFILLAWCLAGTGIVFGIGAAATKGAPIEIWAIAGLLILAAALLTRAAFRKPMQQLAVVVQSTVLTAPQSATERTRPQTAYEGGGTIIADNINTRVLLRYRDSGEEDTERTVRVVRVRGDYAAGSYIPDSLFGFCELRQADRFFVFRHVQAAFDAETGEEIHDLERYLVGRGEQRVRNVEFSQPTPEEAAEDLRIKEWYKANGGLGTRHLLPPPLVWIEAHEAGRTGEFSLAIETVEQYGGRPFALAGLGKQIVKGGRRRGMRFTLPGFHTPEWEITSLRPDGTTEPVTDIVSWLSQQGRRGKGPPHKATSK
jgi:hypothetical protein